MADGEQIEWLNGGANVPGVVEKICPNKHIRQGQWQSEWNEMYINDRSNWCYDYISDYECIFDHPIDENVEELYINTDRDRWDNLQAAKRQGTHVPISSLAHFTKHDVAEEIIKSGGFKGGCKKINKDQQGGDVEAKFSWWSPKFSGVDKELVRDRIGEAIMPFLHQHDDNGDDDDENGDHDDDDNDDQVDDQDTFIRLKNQFATSDAFTPNCRRYGSSYFQYDTRDLCHYYGNHFEGEVQFKILGTFGYKNEVMHAVLVCSEENGAGMFREYPEVLTPEQDTSNESVVTRDNDGNWIWKPQATATEIKRLYGQATFPKYRRWEHVAFAFHLPGELQFTVDDLTSHLHEL